ncbi:hypothetical protein G7Y89_g4589 [Cudoniella acicularis]|uniref:Uncharacterized protein n=1 Tax=Cudoniella acicularis TaxID=354080 RepID=A0A8H4RP53_9HELO|nr:hypothetical protein G7Y89_g4589 [Cudoniella acicularis]
MEKCSQDALENLGSEALLRVVVLELRELKKALSRQDEQLEAFKNGTTNLNPSKQKLKRKSKPDTEISTWRSRKESVWGSPPSTTIISLPHDMRLGSILQEAITRYNSDAVPSWSSQYGERVIKLRGEGPDTAEDSFRNARWTKIVGECWKIPHDNRINLCFRTDSVNHRTLVRVRNFIMNFHKLDYPDSPRGEYFHVWDWFDSGISAYWCPGTKSTTTPLRNLSGIGGEQWEQLNSATALSIMIAPWRRIINMQGLTSLYSAGSPVDTSELSDEDLCPFLSETKNAVFQDPMDEILWRTVKLHLRCLRASDTEHSAMATKGWIMFHVTFYEILDFQSHKRIELWPSGELHSDYLNRPGKPRKIRESAFTIIAIPSTGLPGTKLRSVFWTMLCLRPNQFPHLQYSESRDDLSRGRTHNMVDELSDLVHTSLVVIIRRWEEISCYFDRLLVERHGLLDPAYHDSLLIDDAAFTRSKKYFWAIEFLQESEASIMDVIEQCNRFMDLMSANPPFEEVAKKNFNARLKKHQVSVQRLRALRNGFIKKQEEAKALRDGLFSASAVMESRAATQLGENIKLLTYVSIFFLPISVCTRQTRLTLQVVIEMVGEYEGIAGWYPQYNAYGSCNQINHEEDFVAAISTSWLNNYCGKILEITNKNNNRSVKVAVGDYCRGCLPDYIKISKVAYRALAGAVGSEEERINITWRML